MCHHYHDVLRVEMESRHLPVERVEIGHPPGDVDGELEGAGGVNHEAGALMEDLKEEIDVVDTVLLEE